MSRDTNVILCPINLRQAKRTPSPIMKPWLWRGAKL